MKLMIEIKLDNSAYSSNEDEIKENLLEIVKKITWGDDMGIVFDSNGNRSGHWRIDDEA